MKWFLCWLFWGSVHMASGRTKIWRVYGVIFVYAKADLILPIELKVQLREVLRTWVCYQTQHCCLEISSSHFLLDRSWKNITRLQAVPEGRGGGVKWGNHPRLHVSGAPWSWTKWLPPLLQGPPSGGDSMPLPVLHPAACHPHPPSRHWLSCPGPAPC